MTTDSVRVVLHQDADEWIRAQPPGPTKKAVEAWLIGLLHNPPDAPSPEEPEEWCFIRNTTVAASYMSAPEYGRVYVDAFEDLDPTG